MVSTRISSPEKPLEPLTPAFGIVVWVMSTDSRKRARTGPLTLFERVLGSVKAPGNPRN